MKDIKQSTEEVKRRIKSMGVVKLTVLALMIAGTVCSFVFNDYIFPADSVFNRGISDSEFINDLLAFVPKIIQAARITTVILVFTTAGLAALNLSLIHI